MQVSRGANLNSDFDLQLDVGLIYEMAWILIHGFAEWNRDLLLGVILESTLCSVSLVGRHLEAPT